jgi:hypothetical protein
MLSLSPFCKRLDRAQKYQTKPEIHDYTKIHMGGIVPSRSWQVWHDQKVDNVSRQDGGQRLKKIHPSWF